MVPSCLPGHDALSGTTQRDLLGSFYDLPRSNFEVDLSMSPITILVLMASGDLNINLTQKKLFIKVVGLLANYQTPYIVCGSDSWFSRSDGGGQKAPARFRTFQIAPGKGLAHVCYASLHSNCQPPFSALSAFGWPIDLPHCPPQPLRFQNTCVLPV